MLKPDEIDWIATDSKMNAEVLHTLLKSLGRKGYVLHSETVGEDWAKEFLDNPNAFIEKYKPDYIIISPTAESGVSVTINNYFTRKFSFFCGVLSTNSQHQMMFRLRNNEIPHYVFCPTSSAIRDTSNPKTYLDKVFQKDLEELIAISASLAGSEAAEFFTKALTRQSPEWWQLSLNWGAWENFEKDNLRTCLISALEEAGHEVTVEEWLENKEVTEQVAEARVFVQKKKASELYHAEEFTDRNEAEKAAKKQVGLVTQRKVEKTFLLDRLPGIKDTEIWAEDFIYNCHLKNRQFIEQQYRYWLLKHPDLSQKRHDANWYFLATSEFFFSGHAKKFRHDKIWALNELGILQFEGREYHKDSVPVLNLVEKLRSRRDIQLERRYSNHDSKLG